MTFVDSGAWYAVFAEDDTNHPAAAAWMDANTDDLLTTDYILDETLTLFRSRGRFDLALVWGQDVLDGKLGTLHYLTRDEIAAAWGVFRRFRDKAWSFTDCTSKVVMESLGIRTAFAFDHHFRQFGTVAVVP